MLKFLVFTIFLVTSPTFGLLETLYQVENDCYSGCHSNYMDNLLNIDACKEGCDFKIHSENCVDQCKLRSIHETIQASCVVGCSMSRPVIKQSIEKPHVHSIILIRRRPFLRLRSSNADSVKMANDIIKQVKQNLNSVEQSSEIKPLIKSLNLDSLNEVNIKRFKHITIHQEDALDRLEQFIKDIRSKSNELFSKRPKLPILILLGIFITLSTILSCMIVSLCRKPPRHHNLSIHAQELIFEKENIHPDSPVKINLTNI